MKHILLLILLVAKPLFAKDFYDKIRIRDTTDATSTTGALRVDGGLNVTKFSYFGNSMTIARSAGPSLSIQDLAGAIGTNAAPLLNFRDSSSTMAHIGYDSTTSYDLNFTALSSVAGFTFKQGPSRTIFLSASQNGDWLMPFGLGLGTGTGSTTNIINARKDQNSVTRAIVSNQNTGSGAYSKITAASDGGDFDFIANSVAAGAVTQITSASGFTAGLEINQLGTNPVKIKTNGTTRVTVGGSSGEAQLEKPLVLAQSSTPSNPNSGYNKIYPKSDDKIYTLNSAGNETELLTATSAGLEAKTNQLYNANFAIWQRGTSTTVANGATGYQADRWYVKNSLGTNGVITYSRIAGSNDGSKYGASIQITTAPTASQANGTELYQTLENLDSVRLYNQSASFSIKLKALGNVNQAGVQFYYKTTEAKVDTGIGSEQTCAISTGSFATCSISGQTLGTSQTTSGVIGIRIRITGVSTGNTYDLNNGIIAEQAMMVEGTTTVSFASKFQSAAAELLALQRYYEKSYDLSVDPATTSNTGGYRYRNPFGGDNTVTVVFKATKKSTPSIVFYNPSSGSTGTAREDGGNDRSLSIDGTAGLSSAPVLVTGGSQNQYTTFHWTSDAEI